jgi:hypothetical protein
MTDDMYGEPDVRPGVVELPRTTLLVALGALALAGTALLVSRALQESRRLRAVNPDNFIVGDDWKMSMQHLADAIGYRMSGLEQRMDELANRAPIGVRQPVDVPPAPEPVSANGEAVSGEHGAGNEPPAPPPPAVVSIPDIGGGDL